MNLRAIKIIDLQHSVLDNSAVEKLQSEVAHFESRKKEVQDIKVDGREKNSAEKEADRDEKLINFGVAINELTEQMEKEREAILSEQRTGIYRFKHKSYVNYRDAGRRPPWKFLWCWYSDSDNYGMYRDWQVEFGSTAVVFNKDRYVPEGVPVTSEGHFIYKDVILMREDLQKYLRRQIEAKQRGEAAGPADIKALDAQFAEGGGKLPDGYMEEVISEGGR